MTCHPITTTQWKYKHSAHDCMHSCVFLLIQGHTGHKGDKGEPGKDGEKVSLMCGTKILAVKTEPKAARLSVIWCFDDLLFCLQGDSGPPGPPGLPGTVGLQVRYRVVTFL